MFSSLKDKLLNVTKTVPLFNTNSERQVQSEVNLNAGGEILLHYQKEWEVIHRTNEENAQRADAAANTIASIGKKIDRDKKSLNVMTNILTNSNLKLHIVQCTRQIEQLYKAFNAVEENLLKLEDLIDNTEFEKMKKQHRFHLQQYKSRKEESLRMFGDSLKEKHRQVLEEAENKKKKELEERQKVFHEAFKSDLEIFKSFGTIPKLDLPKQPSALLEEIQVDYDEKELDQFFEENTQ